MEIRKRRKPHEPREVKQPKMIKWVAIDVDDFKAEIGGYTLRAENLDKWNWWAAVYFGNETVWSTADSVHKTSLQQAKSAAVFQMNKHKKELMRKTVNHAN